MMLDFGKVQSEKRARIWAGTIQKKMSRRAVDAAADIPLSIAGSLSSILQMEKQVVNHYFSIHRESTMA